MDWIVGLLDWIGLVQQADRRFFWNHHLIKDFMRFNLDDWIVPVMDGCMY
jgi:hypothetical protein